MNRLCVSILCAIPLLHATIQIASAGEDDLEEMVRAPLRAFIKTEPVDCSSPNLQKAVRFIAVLEDVSKEKGGDLEIDRQFAGLALEVADAALSKGCLDTADNMYRHVITRYIGTGYVALRQRAQIGVDDVRAARK